MKRSSFVGFWFFKLIGVLFSVLGFMLLHGLIFPEQSFINGLDRTMRDNEWLSLSTMLLFTVFIAYYTLFRLAEIEYNENGIKELKSNESSDWGQIKSVIKIPFCTPPIYRISFAKDGRSIFAIMSISKIISVGFYSWDLTGFYGLAKNKTKT